MGLIKHGHAVGGMSLTYRAWSGAKGRCYNPADILYHYYGGRGIGMAERWRDSFENFLADMGECPPGMSLDRYPNNNGDYEPGNCRWATDLEQGRNRRNNHLLRCYSSSKGEKPLSEWAAIAGVHRTTIERRLKKGWTHKEAVFCRPRERMWKRHAS